MKNMPSQNRSIYKGVSRTPYLVGIFLLLGLLSIGCSGQSDRTLIDDVQVQPVGAAEGDAPDPTPTATREPAGLEAVQIVGRNDGAMVVEIQEGSDEQAPVRFTFPTAMPPLISAWRPPLYEIPWAPTKNDHFYFSRPIAADEINWPVEDYRYGGVFFDDNIHTGVDIPAPFGTAVIASASGKVVKAGYGVYTGRSNPEDPYGLAVVIQHDFGYEGNPLYTVYGHLSQIDVVDGQRVETGELLGLVGETGFTTGPHLHFEVRIGENRFLTTRNPELWVAPPLGWGVLVGRVMDTNGRLARGHVVYVKNLETGQLWRVFSYGKGPINPDAHYQENVVMGDLPAGVYELRIPFFGVYYEQEIQVLPGRVSYFTFEGYKGFGDPVPPAQDSEFVPPR